LALAGNGELLAAGGISGSPDFDGNKSPDTKVPNGEFATFVVRYTADGRLVWLRTFSDSRIWHLTANDKRIVLSGFYNEPLDFDGNGSRDGEATADGNNEGLIAILDNQGGLLQVLTVVGQDSDQVRASGFSPDGETLWSTGFVRLTADFDADGQPEGAVRCDHRGDIFGARYDLGSLESSAD
jgi:hypothetical protein